MRCGWFLPSVNGLWPLLSRRYMMAVISIRGMAIIQNAVTGLKAVCSPWLPITSCQTTVKPMTMETLSSIIIFLNCPLGNLRLNIMWANKAVIKVIRQHSS